MKNIGVVGAGLVGSLFKDRDGFEVVHRDEWEPVRWLGGLVNCAGIVGRVICEETDFERIISANVGMPLKMFEACHSQSIPFITFSTSAVYRASEKTGDRVTEESLLYPHNTYAASKILMEGVLPHGARYIFRIPRVVTNNGHPNDFREHIKNWKVCEDVYRSVVYPETIIKAVDRALTNPNLPYGTYNIASEAVHLPTFIKEEYGWEGEIVEPYSLGYYPEVVLDVKKAEEVGLI